MNPSKIARCLWLAAAVASLNLAATGCGLIGGPKGISDEPLGESSLVIIFEGLRPDYVNRELMPHLYKLARRGVEFRSHHAVLPLSAAVSAASISTGTFPDKHGMVGDTLYFPGVWPGTTLDSQDPGDLARIERSTGGALLTSVTLGELLQTMGRKIFVTGSGSPGAAMLLNHRARAGAIVHRLYTRPRALAAQARVALDNLAQTERPAIVDHRWAIDSFLNIGLDVVHPTVSFIWFSDPLRIQLIEGAGSPGTLEVLGALDAELGRLLQALKSRDLLKSTNIIVTSTRGFSSPEGTGDLDELMRENDLLGPEDSPEAVVIGNSIFVKDHDRAKIRAIVERLQRTPWVGPVFIQQARPTHPEGFVLGALSLQAIHADHARAPDILVTPNWSDRPNRFGYPGTTSASPSMAFYGSTSPHDLDAVLIAAGPDFRRGKKIDLPTSIVDLAPTLCYLSGIEPPLSMDGRVLREALRGGPDPSEIKVLERTYRSRTRWPVGGYLTDATESSIGGTDYLTSVAVERWEEQN